MHAVHAEFRCPDAATADAVRRALLPEAHDPPEGCRLALDQEGPLLHLHVDAPDAGALRAALQGTLRLVDAALQTAAGRPGAGSDAAAGARPREEDDGNL